MIGNKIISQWAKVNSLPIKPKTTSKNSSTEPNPAPVLSPSPTSKTKPTPSANKSSMAISMSEEKKAMYTLPLFSLTYPMIKVAISNFWEKDLLISSINKKNNFNTDWVMLKIHLFILKNFNILKEEIQLEKWVITEEVRNGKNNIKNKWSDFKKRKSNLLRNQKKKVRKW